MHAQTISLEILLLTPVMTVRPLVKPAKTRQLVIYVTGLTDILWKLMVLVKTPANWDITRIKKNSNVFSARFTIIRDSALVRVREIPSFYHSQITNLAKIVIPPALAVRVPHQQLALNAKMVFLKRETYAS